jgi:hypothetical protein
MITNLAKLLIILILFFIQVKTTKIARPPRYTGRSLCVRDPIQAPLLDYKPLEPGNLAKCMQEANCTARVDTMPSSMYYKYRFYQCNPYNGSYAQCTNNYIPLPPVGLCEENGYNEDVCPYKLKPSTMYGDTYKCLHS